MPTCRLLLYATDDTDPVRHRAKYKAKLQIWFPGVEVAEKHMPKTLPTVLGILAIFSLFYSYLTLYEYAFCLFSSSDRCDGGASNLVFVLPSWDLVLNSSHGVRLAFAALN